MKKKLLTWFLVALLVWGLHALMPIIVCLLTHGEPSEMIERVIRQMTESGDATRYLDIAQNGYVTTGENAINLVFYPLYPLLIRLFSHLTGGLKSAALLISQLSYAGSGILLFELLSTDGSSRQAWEGVLLFALYPFSMFAMSIYSEGLFLLLTIGCLYAIRKKCFIAAGITGFLAALTRVQGMLLFIPAAYEVVCLRLSSERRSLRPSDASVLLVPAGFGVYLGINYALHGSCFKFLEYEAAPPWYQSTQWIGRNIETHYNMAFSSPHLSGIIYWPQIVLYFLTLAILLWGVYKKHRTGELLYGGAYLGFTYLSGWMISGGRYIGSCVPIFILLSRMKEGVGKSLLFAGMGILFFAYSLFFLRGFAIM